MDTPSSFLFKIFIEDYLTTINHARLRSLTNVLVDYVLLLKYKLIAMQKLFNASAAWASKPLMEWSMSKSCRLKLDGLVTIIDQQLKDKNE